MSADEEAAEEELAAAAKDLGTVGGILRFKIGDARPSGVSTNDFKRAAISASLSASQLRMLAANIRNVVEARQMAKDLGQLEDYNLLGIDVTFEAKSFKCELIMRTGGG